MTFWSVPAASGTPFLPTDVTTATLLGWGDENSMTLSGDNLTNWTNNSGALSTLSTGGTATITTATDANINGRRKIILDGVDNHLESTIFTEIAQPYHLFLVFRPATWTDDDTIAYLDQTVSGNPSQINQNISSPAIDHLAGTASVNAVSATLDTWWLLESYFNGGSSYQRLNEGSAVSGGNPGTAGMDQFTIGAYPTGTRAAHMDVAGYALYDGTVSGADLSNLRDGYFNREFTLW